MPNQVLSEFDFSDIEPLSLEERIARSIQRARKLIAKHNLAPIHDAPMVPAGASEAELAQLERELGVELPPEYRFFLTRHRYLLLGEGYDVGGLQHGRVQYCEPLWVAGEQDTNTEYLVFGKFWAHADGDHLMFDLSKPERPVVACLREHGPLYEAYAPSFSLALWRLVAAAETAASHDEEDDDFEDDYGFDDEPSFD